MSTVRIQRGQGTGRRTWYVSVDGTVVATLRAGGATENMSLIDAFDLVAEVSRALGAKVER